MTDSRLLRGAVLTFDDDPGESPVPRPDSLRYWEDGAVWLENGHIRAVDDYTTLAPHVPAGLEIVDYRGKLIMPGFIDSHVHYSQLDIIASFGRELLDWLNDYTFPAECRFAERAHAEEVAERFLDELLRGGTTTAQVFCTSHPGSVDSIFSAARARRLRMLAGKVLMDRHAPEALIDTAVGGIRDSERLIADWHGKDRLSYSLTPRFAPTSSRAQLDAVGGVLRRSRLGAPLVMLLPLVWPRKSRPAQKARPRPVRTIARTSASASASTRCSVTAPSISREIVFIRSAAFRVRTAIPSSTS